jgi:integration host factor subunit beta
MRDVELGVDMILARIGEQLLSGGRIEIRGFGIWSTHVRAGRCGRNPATGEPVTVRSKAVIHFKPGRELADRVNASRLPGTEFRCDSAISD